MKTTFDSNVWRIISSPDKFPNDPSIEDLKVIRKAIDEKKIIPFLCETVFTLEAIKRKDRKEFFSGYKPNVNTSVEYRENGEVKLSFSIGPDQTAHPGNNPYLESHLIDATAIGFQIIKLPRIGAVVNPEIEELFYKHDDLNAYQNRAFDVSKAIESRKAGMFHIEEIGKKYADQWVVGIEQAPSHEEGNIAKAIAEWADGDSVACHIALGGDYFCTRDSAKSGGDKSIFSEENLKWLDSTYGFHTLSPEELAGKC